MHWLAQILNYTAFDIEIVRWALALAIVFLTVGILTIIKRLVFSHLPRWSTRSRLRWLTYVEAIFRRTAIFISVAVALIAASFVFDISDRPAEYGLTFIKVLVAIQFGIWISATATVFIDRYCRTIEDDAAQVTALTALKFVIRLVVWAVVFLMILDNIGFDITALVASLGIGGIAIALAAQNILGDLFAFFSIIVDKPFVQNDFIVVGDYLGSIEHIGIKTTRLRSLSGEQLIFSNQDLLGSRIRNFKRMEERRVLFEFGVVYDTPKDQLAAIPDLVQKFVEKHELTRFDRAHFKGFGDSSLKFEVVYWILSPEYNVYMDIHEQILFDMLTAFRSRDVEFAFPTRTIRVSDPQKPTRAPAP